MQDQVILELFAQSTITVLIFGILIGSLFSIAILAIFDAIKACNAKYQAEKEAAAKPVAVKKAPAKKAPAKKAAVKKAPAKKKAAAKKK